MPIPFGRRDESTGQPGLENATSSSSMSSSSLADYPLHRQSNWNSSQQNGNRRVANGIDEPDPILCGRSDAGWSMEEQDRFISLIGPHIEGRCLSEDEVELLRSEARLANLPVECVDRLLAKKARSDRRGRLSKYRAEEIEHVDESDNILAYFSRMSTLKQGGHFPSLNTEAISPFVDEDICDISQDIEVDLDVGYVDKSLNVSMETHGILLGEESSWFDSDDNLSQVSTAIADHRSRYDPYQHNKPNTDAFEALLVGNKSEEVGPGINSRAHWESSDKDSIEKHGTKYDSASTSNGEETSTTWTHTTDEGDWAHPTAGESDWAPPTARPQKTYRYGYERDLEEWRRKRDIALWQPPSGSRSSGTSFFSCQAMAEAAVADELNGLLFGTKRNPPRLRGKTAIRLLVEETGKRKQLRHERNQLRHVPEKNAAAPKPWQLPYRERCKTAPGYMGVDQFSLMDTAAAIHPRDGRDALPWEVRDVRQHFLHDQSISLSRNWFGRLRRKNGNDLIKFRPCRPPTMAMPSEHPEESVTDFDDCEWTDAPSKTTDAPSKATLSKSWLSTASKSWRTNKVKEDVNKTASMSFTSGEEDSSDHSHTDDDWTGNTRSVLAQSSAATSREGNSTDDDDDGKGNQRMEVDFSAMLSSVVNGGNYGVPWLSDDVSTIVDDNKSQEDHWSKKDKPETVTSATTDRYVSSSSSVDQSSTPSDDSSETSNPTSTCSSRSYYSGDSESTSSYCTEDAPECGTLVNVKPILGERVSRVTYNHTSHLLRSRFRKKYLRQPPFDKYMN